MHDNGYSISHILDYNPNEKDKRLELNIAGRAASIAHVHLMLLVREHTA